MPTATILINDMFLSMLNRLNSLRNVFVVSAKKTKIATAITNNTRSRLRASLTSSRSVRMAGSCSGAAASVARMLRSISGLWSGNSCISQGGRPLFMFGADDELDDLVGRRLRLKPFADPTTPPQDHDSVCH